MPRKRYYLTIEVNADTYGSGPSNDEVMRAIWNYLGDTSKDAGSIYIQGIKTLTLMDEKGNNLLNS